MADVTMAEAKRDFRHGLITGADVVRPGMSAGVWSVVLRYTVGGPLFGSVLLVDARTRKPREFRTLDAAFSALEQIGLRPEALKV